MTENDLKKMETINEIQSKEYLNSKEVEILFSIPISTQRYYRWLEKNNRGNGFPSLKLGKRVLYNKKDLINWINDTNNK